MQLHSLGPTGKSWLMAWALLFSVAWWPPVSPAEADLVVIASDGFESGSYRGGEGWAAEWNVSSAVSIVTADQPHNGVRHLEMRGAAVASRKVDLTGWTDVEVRFRAKARALEPGDFVTVEVSPDGRDWVALETWVDGDDDSQYYLYEYDLSGVAQGETLYIRFLSQMDDPSDHFYVDDVAVQAEPVPGSASTMGSSQVSLTSVPIAGVTSTLATNSSGIVIDGAFSEWVGYPNLTDPPGDATKARGDLFAFYWGNNTESEVNYWMIERYPASEDDEDDEDEEGGEDTDPGNSLVKKVKYTIYLDTNNDGNFAGQEDRRVLLDYHPKASHSEVRLTVKHGSGGQVLYSADGDWGETVVEGGRRVELAVPWSDLGITNGDVTRMYVESHWDDRLPNSGDVQWSPASILGAWLLAASLALGAVALWQIRKRKEQTCPSGLE